MKYSIVQCFGAFIEGPDVRALQCSGPHHVTVQYRNALKDTVIKSLVL